MRSYMAYSNLFHTTFILRVKKASQIHEEKNWVVKVLKEGIKRWWSKRRWVIQSLHRHDLYDALFREWVGDLPQTHEDTRNHNQSYVHKTQMIKLLYSHLILKYDSFSSIKLYTDYKNANLS